MATCDDLKCCDDGDQGFTGSHIALKEAPHGMLLTQVRFDIYQNIPLIRSQIKGQALNESLSQGAPGTCRE